MRWIPFFIWAFGFFGVFAYLDPRLQFLSSPEILFILFCVWLVVLLFLFNHAHRVLEDEDPCAELKKEKDKSFVVSVIAWSPSSQLVVRHSMELKELPKVRDQLVLTDHTETYPVIGKVVRVDPILTEDLYSMYRVEVKLTQNDFEKLLSNPKWLLNKA